MALGVALAKLDALEALSPALKAKRNHGDLTVPSAILTGSGAGCLSYGTIVCVCFDLDAFWGRGCWETCYADLEAEIFSELETIAQGAFSAVSCSLPSVLWRFCLFT